jgi:predicted dehydrogenase
MRLGIVGSDNSHALGFAKAANVDQLFGDEVRVTTLSSSDAEQAHAVAREGKIDEVVEAPVEMLGKIDAAIIVDRHGGLHRQHAEPLLGAGLPVLVDKPLATTIGDAAAILNQAHATGALVTSYSSLRWCEGTSTLQSELVRLGSIRFAQVSGPCDLHSVYGGHFFYGIHHAEIALALLPGPVHGVSVVQFPGVATAFLRRDSGPLVTLNLLDPTGPDKPRYPFHALLIGDASFAAAPIQTDPDLRQALGRFLDMIKSGEPPLSDEEMLEPIRVLDAITRALEVGGAEVPVDRTR